MTKLSKTHRQSIVKYAIEALRMFGSYRTIAENMSYFIQNIEIHNKYKIDWKCLNKLTIAYKYLDIGITYDFEGRINKFIDNYSATFINNDFIEKEEDDFEESD
jgi:hypothetical protein